MTDGMIDRLVTAIAETADPAPEGMWDENTHLIAIACLKAMREPTPAMVEAYNSLCDIGGDLRQTSGHDGNEDVRNAYRAMIDAAIAEAQSKG